VVNVTKKILTAVLLAGVTVPLFAQGLINRRAPSFSLPDMNFTQHDILDYRGKWLLIEFMSTSPQNCPGCREITRKLDALVAKYGGKLAVLAITQTPPETQDTVRSYLNETRSKIPHLFDTSMVGIAYFKATPQRPAIDLGHIFAVNPQGTIVQNWTQQMVLSPQFNADIDRLVAGPAAPAKSK
jgi:peroxiredoxin